MPRRRLTEFDPIDTIVQRIGEETLRQCTKLPQPPRACIAMPYPSQTAAGMAMMSEELHRRKSEAAIVVAIF
jgi:hypothetical protein